MLMFQQVAALHHPRARINLKVWCMHQYFVNAHLPSIGLAKSYHLARTQPPAKDRTLATVYRSVSFCNNSLQSKLP